MFHIRMPIHLVPALVLLLTLAVSAPAQAGSAAITWYQGGETRLSLNPVPVDSASHVALAGRTTQKTLIVKVAKKGGNARSNPIPLADDGSFSVRYLLKDGAGSYTVTFYGSELKGALNYQGLGFFVHTVGKKQPSDPAEHELNGRVIEFVDSVLGTSVGRGECWDLAQQALDVNLADWTRPTTFGRPIDSETGEIRAGDIIQFRALTVTEHTGGGVRRTTFGAPDHTAVIYSVLGKKQFILAHQNFGENRTVMKSSANLTHVTGGTYRIYRPVALMVRQ